MIDISRANGPTQIDELSALKKTMGVEIGIVERCYTTLLVAIEHHSRRL
jgi:hypothetical protein